MLDNITTYGLKEAIPQQLYFCDLTQLSSIFVEKVGDSYSCYKLTWNDGAKQPREVKNEKVYIIKDTFLKCLKRAEYVIKWYVDNKKRS